ncbi:hypothetical protein SUGI_0613730 [Cryptomeria japonica]|uniref:transportin MOS14 isoform X2 n=1 Tax=Cryptomeria japonica TaxID=3369 RepID=UPI002414C6DD|nr:transportin MOS14 isoform X2 [Cryptomeria japonica]GLJ30869.1 hypothetical protein SUGI_0613730 [Cryptomeria japonica]
MSSQKASVRDTLQEALKALYHHPEQQVRNQANVWLQEFQRTIEAWEVSDSLLHDANSNLETLIFCSQTLKTKVQRDFEELPPATFVPLRDSLKNLLKKFCKGPSKVRTQICIALAALAMHVPAQDWGGGGVLNWLRDELGSQREYIHSFLELLTVLPQEAYSHKIAVRPERRRQFQKELISSVEVAFSLLTSCLNVEELQEQVLEAFASWLRLSHGIPAAALASHPLVLAAISGLSSEQLFESAVNAICELIHYTETGSPGGLAEQMPLVQVLVPQIMGLRNRFSASLKVALMEKQGSQGGESGVDQAYIEDEEIVKAMARLFAEMGDCYVELIASGSNESMMIIEALVEVTSHPEYDIASMTFNFWHSLQTVLTKREYYTSFGNEAAIEAEKERRLTIFRPTFELLVSLVSFRVMYPHNYERLSREDLADFKRTRYAVGDILLDASSVLSGEVTLKILSNNFFQAGSTAGNGDSWDWRSAEAALYCIRAIARAVPISEETVLPQVIGFLVKLPLQPQLLQTACLTIGAYSKWLGSASGASSFLPSIIEILTRAMTTSEDSSTAAAMALRHVCDACRDKLAGSLDGLFHIYHKAVSRESGYKLSTEDALQLIEALSMVITALPPEHAKKALEALCIPAVTPLQQVIAQAARSPQQFSANQYTIPIDRLSNIFRYVSHPEAVGDAFQNIWPTLKAVFDQRAWDMQTMERLCRACKYAVRTCGKSIGVTISDMLQVVQLQYQVHHQSCFLYLSSEVIKIFGSDPSCGNYLGGLINSLFGHTISLLKSIQDFTSRPDIADDCFLLASRCIRYCPHLFVPSTIFPPLVDCSMIGITIQHREACISILTFLNDIFDVATSIGGKQYRSIIDNVILPRATSLTRILIGSLAGALPESRLEEVISVLMSMTRIYGIQVVNWAQEAISLIPSTAITDGERSSFLGALSSAASGANSPALIGSLEELSDVCRRNKTVQEIVQGALQPLRLTLTTAS